MSRILARLVLAGSAVMGTPVIFTLVFAITERQLSDEVGLALAAFVSIAYFVPTWIAVWRTQVVWTSRRLQLTAFSILWCTLLGLLVGGLTVAVVRYGDELAIVLGSMAWLPAWIASTALVWKETAGEQAERLRGANAGKVKCPECDYDMTGLREARCPECGTQYTLDQLFGAAMERLGSTRMS